MHFESPVYNQPKFIDFVKSFDNESYLLKVTSAKLAIEKNTNLKNIKEDFDNLYKSSISFLKNLKECKF